MMFSVIGLKGLYFLSLLFMVLAVPALAVDLPIARFCAQQGVPGTLARLFTWSEVFAHGLGIAVVALTVVVLDRSQWFRLPRVLACAYGAGLLANMVKLMVGRTRPKYFELEAGVGESFLGWFPLLTSETLREALSRNIQSFPSGHAAAATGLAIGLSWLYPQGRVLFVVFAVLAALQRVESNSHFASDTLVAAALACLLAALCFDRRTIGGWFDRLESSLGARRA